LVNKLVLKGRNHSWVKPPCKDYKHLFISNVRKTFIVFPAKSLIKTSYDYLQSGSPP